MKLWSRRGRERGRGSQPAAVPGWVEYWEEEEEEGIVQLRRERAAARTQSRVRTESIKLEGTHSHFFLIADLVPEASERCAQFPDEVSNLLNRYHVV